MQRGAETLQGVHRAPPSAVRVLARKNDSQILIVHGEDRPLGGGERLAWIEWFSTDAVAEAVSAECSRTLNDCPAFKPDVDGWHPFAAEHLANLVNKAKTHLNVTYRPKPEAPRDRQAWTGERIALLGFLAGQGWSAKRIAEHPLIRSTEGNIFRQAHRFNIALLGSSQDQLVLRRIPVSAKAALEHAAERIQLTREALASRLLIEALGNEEMLAAACGLRPYKVAL